MDEGGFQPMLKLSDEETDLVSKIEAFLESRNKEESALVKQRFDSLNALGMAISLYQSIRDNQTLRGIERSEEHLLEALCSIAASSRLLHTPAKVVATRSYLVAKFQAFSLLHILVREQDEFYRPIRKIVFTIIHTLMVEEVYFSCLDDPRLSHELKFNLANDLVSLWDSGSDPHTVQHLPVLDALWTARDSAPPSFGTMNGTTELLRITIDLGTNWQDFLVAHMSVNETRWALEEFLFGLSYEEINSVRARLVKFGINAVSHEEIPYYLGSQPKYGIINSSDYRAVYDFYVDRRDAARSRQRFQAPGPSRTLEEIFLKFCITQE